MTSDSDQDSDFYGDADTVTQLKERVDDFDLEKGWKSQQVVSKLRSEPQPGKMDSASRLHNIYQGVPGAWQAPECLDAFLARYPPSTTRRTSGIDWIRVWNPFLSPPEPQLSAVLRQGGGERLDILSKFILASKTSGKNPFQIDREITKERDDAVNDLRHLAAMTKVLMGKWMLFPEPQDVDEAWRRVARATVNNELGIAAKVAPINDPHERQRLICVYTKDFRDTADIARVLNKLRSLELIRAGGKQIYYKSDAWTDLGIYGGNDWHIPASMHSSNEIFSYITRHGIH
ncbi:protein of unknown function (DUF1917) domain containing protein [Rhypophila decipiens]